MKRTIWMVRAGEESKYFGFFQEKNLVAIGWSKVGDLKTFKTGDKIREAVEKAYPNVGTHSIGKITGYLRKFYSEIKQGHWVITYDRNLRKYLVGKVVSDYCFEEREALNEDFPLAHRRNIEWEKDKKISRDVLAYITKNSLGSLITLFQVGEEQTEDIFRQLGDGQKIPSPLDVDDSVVDDEDVDHVNMVYESVKDKIAGISPRNMEHLAAALFRAMDLAAVVTTEARNSEIITLNLQQFAELIIKHYDNFDIEGRMLLPMQKLYVPVR